MQAAVLETLPLTRRREYPYQREYGWLDGRFDGWSWYIWRARAELGAQTGHWDEAYEAARQCVSARPLSGKEWLILAVCAGRLGHDDEARSAAHHALSLDPTLPEIRYLVGLWEWKAGQRSEASTQFREAMALDSAFVPAALGLMRTRLPGASPDTLPTHFLTGRRRVALLTTSARPKPEEFVQVDQAALIVTSPDTAIVDSIPPGTKPKQLVLSVLVDEQGRAVLNEIPWFPQGAIPTGKIYRLLASVPSWEFQPAVRLGVPIAIWVNVDFYFSP
jgi:tetratricopeptide (TPR) repeat protein